MGIIALESLTWFFQNLKFKIWRIFSEKFLEIYQRKLFPAKISGSCEFYTAKRFYFYFLFLNFIPSKQKIKEKK